ncbi:MAG: zf-HC2 domain-containing protein [Ignavibacteriaceae bacterium]|jgi:hypothetical protein
MKHYDLEISRFIDNELSANEQKELFSHLSNCEDCGKILSDFMEMKQNSRSFYENLSVVLNKTFDLPFGTTQKKGEKLYKLLFYFSAAASIILGAMFLYKSTSVVRLETKYSALELKYLRTDIAKNNSHQNDFNNKSKIIDITSKEKSELSVQKNYSTSQKKNKLKIINSIKSEKNLPPADVKNGYSKLSQRSQEIQIVQVTKNDFLTPQVVGN